MPELYQTISTLWIAIALLGCAGLAWDAARRYMQLAHGRMLNADRSQTFERAITALDLSNKQLDHGLDLDQLKQRMDGIEATALNRIDGIRATADDDRMRAAARYDDHVGRLDEMSARFTGLTDWQKQCEQSIVLLQGEVDKRDKAIVSCVEEIRAIREQQAMALAGVANLPARGFAGKQRTP